MNQLTTIADDEKDNRMSIVHDILAERKRQDEKWGANTDHDDIEWLPILVEEVGELSRALLEEHFRNDNYVYYYSPYNETRIELVQVAAVCLAWLECIDRRPHLEGDQ